MLYVSNMMTATTTETEAKTMDTPAEAIARQIAALQQAADFFTQQIERITGTTNPDTAQWQDTGIGAQAADWADGIIAQAAECGYSEATR